MPRATSRAAFLGTALLGTALVAGCFMSLDENRWKLADRGAQGERGARDLRSDAPQPNDSSSDAAADAKPDVAASDAARTDGPGADAPGADAKKPDGPKPDAKKSDGPKPDTKKPDGPKPDTKKPDAAKPDLPRPDLPKPDLPKPDLPKVDLPGNCAVMNLSLLAAADDGEIWPPDYFPDGETGNEIYLGMDEDPMWGYFRFTLTQAIPAGATIASANLTLFGVGAWQWGGATGNKALNVRAELAADAPAVTGAGDVPGNPANPSSRPITTAVVRWPATGGLVWTTGADHASPSLAPILQEVVTSKGGLLQGSHVQLWLRSAQSSNGAVITPDFKTAGYASHPARLSITVCK